MKPPVERHLSLVSRTSRGRSNSSLPSTVPVIETKIDSDNGASGRSPDSEVPSAGSPQPKAGSPSHGDEKSDKGLFSSILSAAMGSGDEKEKHHSFGNKLDSLLKPRKNELSAASDLSINDESTPDRALLPRNVQFESVRESPVNTLGQGDLLLSHFDEEPTSAEKPVHGSVSVPNAELRRPASPDLVNRMLPLSSQLTTLGTAESKTVRRRSVSMVDKTEDDNITLLDEDEVELEHDLDQIIDYKDIGVASEKRTREFHQIFKEVPKSEELIDDFSCALLKDILVQGRMYLSKHYVCFNSNILGWVTNLIIPLQEVIQIEKKSTAGLFPNGMIIRTLHHKHVFATFISRDTTFNVIISVWHRVLLEGVDLDPSKLEPKKKLPRKESVARLELSHEADDSISDKDSDVVPDTPVKNSDLGSMLSLEQDDGYATEHGSFNEDDTPVENMFEDKEPSTDGTFHGLPNGGPLTHPPTEIEYTKGANDVFITEDVFKAPLGVIFSLLFGKDNLYYVKILQNQKNIDISESDVTELSTKSRERHYTYVKPLGGPIGPKQTKCIIVDKLVEYQLKKYVLVEQITSTPDVPSGNSFQVKTKLFLNWDKNNSTRLYVVTSVEWSGKSWIKSAIEKGSIDGQKESMKVLVDLINEFLESSSKSKDPKKRRRKSVRKKKDSPPPAPEPVQAPPPTLSQQLAGVVETIGGFVPVPIGSDLLKGFITLLLGFLVYTWAWSRLLRPPTVVPEHTVTHIRINNKDFTVVPNAEVYLSNRKKQAETEMALWEWLRERSGGKVDVSGDAKQFANQDLAEVVRITRERLDELSAML